ncbi:MAG: P27 family phage terminase small subunit [Betaproteobacteria bacterium]|nr:P27 family phage terminase small subunit [Betaproteobacteria bacterium]
MLTVIGRGTEWANVFVRCRFVVFVTHSIDSNSPHTKPIPRATDCRSQIKLLPAPRLLWLPRLHWLRQIGLPFEVEFVALAAYAKAYARWVQIANKAASDMMRYAAEFGMTPSARTRIETQASDQNADPADRFFG